MRPSHKYHKLSAFPLKLMANTQKMALITHIISHLFCPEIYFYQPNQVLDFVVDSSYNCHKLNY